MIKNRLGQGEFVMGINSVVAEIAFQQLNKNDSSLYDAIVEYDVSLVNWLVKNKYRLEVINRGFVKEVMSIAKMIEVLEVLLSNDKGIRLIC